VSEYLKSRRYCKREW